MKGFMNNGLKFKQCILEHIKLHLNVHTYNRKPPQKIMKYLVWSKKSNKIQFSFLHHLIFSKNGQITIKSCVRWNCLHQFSHFRWIVRRHQGKCNKELMIQIEWRQIWYLCFTHQSQIVSENAYFFIKIIMFGLAMDGSMPSKQCWFHN